MDIPKDERQDEPNVVPLIDVSLVILVMALVISSVTGRLLPLAVPKAPQTKLVQASETIPLKVFKDGRFQLGDAADLDRNELNQLLDTLEDGTIVMISAEPGVQYASAVGAIDSMMGRKLKMAFGRLPPPAPAGGAEKAAETPAEGGGEGAAPAEGN